MIKIKWAKGGRGLQYYFHDTRKHGINFDRCFRGRYKVDGKETVVVFGWESEWVSGEKARMKASGEKVSRISFADFCKGEILRLKDNARKGTGPTTLKEEKSWWISREKKRIRKERT